MQDSKSYFEQYNQFGDACSVPVGTICDPVPLRDTITMSMNLVHEEWREETEPAVKAYMANPSIENFAEVADGIVDTIYVLCQLGRVLGVPLDAVWDEVQAANMRKVGADGKVLRRADGKILKPEGWKPPAVWDICYAEYVKKMQREQGSKALGD